MDDGGPENQRIKLSRMESMLEIRLHELRLEFKAGEERLEKFDRGRVQLKDTLLRISGAIQVLEELLVQEQRENHKGDASELSEEKRVATG